MQAIRMHGNFAKALVAHWFRFWLPWRQRGAIFDAVQLTGMSEKRQELLPARDLLHFERRQGFELWTPVRATPIHLSIKPMLGEVPDTDYNYYPAISLRSEWQSRHPLLRTPRCTRMNSKRRKLQTTTSPDAPLLWQQLAANLKISTSVSLA